MTAYAALRDRYLGDRAREQAGEHALAELRLEKALDEIGWRSADGLPSDEVARIAVEIVRECVQVHRDVSRATHELAELLRAAAALLDGGSMPAAMFIPAAEEIIALYAGNRI